MPENAPARAPRRGRRDTTTDFSAEEHEARSHLLDDHLARMRFPATKQDVTRQLKRIPQQELLPQDAVRALPERQYENAEDVRYTLDALGAFGEPRRLG